MKTITMLITMLAMLAVIAACGSAAEESFAVTAHSAPAPAAAPAAPAPQMQSKEMADASVQGLPGLPSGPGFPGNPGVAAAPAPAAPAAAAMPATAQEVVREAEVEKVTESEASLVTQKRMVVYTADMQLVVADVQNALQDIGALAESVGGWVVGSNRDTTHSGYTSIRVPAERLDDTMAELRNMSIEVQSESTTSQDVTDEYFDLRSRVKSLQATEQALIKLLDRAEKVEDALAVQQELARLQVEIEAHLGRIKLLEETAAYSLITAYLTLAPAEMGVDAGADKTYSVGEFARFRATFMPPEGIDDFEFTWDFGDGTPPVQGYGSAPTTQPGQRITATVNHFYEDDRDSPYIVEVKIRGVGEAGIAEGEDTFIATVTEVPAIVVYAGDFRMVDEGDEETYSGSFTRPEGLRNYQYKWDFGDGSPALTGAVEGGASKIETTHIFENHRPLEYMVTLTITAESDAGKVEGVGSFGVYAQEVEGFVVSGWNAGDNLKSAIRALSGLAQVAGTALIWLAIFSPAWLVLAAIVYGFVRFRRRLIDNSRRRQADESPTQNSSEEEQD